MWCLETKESLPLLVSFQYQCLWEESMPCPSLALLVPQAPSCLTLRKTEMDNMSSPFSSFMTLGKSSFYRHSVSILFSFLLALVLFVT